jgi:hypothetical protein
MAYKIAVVVLLLPSILLRGFVVVKLWGWYVLPFGVSQIGMAHALGISLFLSLLSQQHQPARDSREKYEILISTIVGPLWVLLFGWIFQHWM